MREDDLAAVRAIYAHYVQHTVVTFDTAVPSAEEMRRLLLPVIESQPAFVCLKDEVLVGYAYVHPWKTKEAYRLTVETTIYLHPDHTHHGYGRALMERLIGACRERGYHVLVACITVPNEASVALHRALGFSRASHFSEVGRKFGRWLDVEDLTLQLTGEEG